MMGKHSFVGRISDSVIRQDHAILLGYAALTQPTNIIYKQQVSPTTFFSILLTQVSEFIFPKNNS